MICSWTWRCSLKARSCLVCLPVQLVVLSVDAVPFCCTCCFNICCTCCFLFCCDVSTMLLLSKVSIDERLLFWQPTFNIVNNCVYFAWQINILLLLHCVQSFQCRIKGGARGSAAPWPAVLGAHNWTIGGSGKFLCPVYNSWW